METHALIWKDAIRNTTVESPMTPVARKETFGGLYKLVLTVAQACNLKCTYCYAEGGPYGEDVTLMTENMAKKSVREMFLKYKPINTLQFFGGEPTLNLKAMYAAVKELRIMKKEGLIINEPQYAIVTNALKITDDLIVFFKKTNMKITVSHDGPQLVQDKQRMVADGSGSWEIINHNLKKMMNNDVNFDIQCTYTKKHYINGYNIPELLEYFTKLGAKRVDIVPVTVPSGDSLDVFHSEIFSDVLKGYREAVVQSFKNMSNQGTRLGMVDEALTLLRKQTTKTPHYCNAGVSTLTISSNGDIYPCFMFINKQGFKLGSIGLSHEQAKFSRDPSYGIDKGCPGREFMMNQEISPFDRDTELKNTVLDTVLDCLSEIVSKEEERLEIA